MQQQDQLAISNRAEYTTRIEFMGETITKAIT
jgi:hypothetical protein